MQICAKQSETLSQDVIALAIKIGRHIEKVSQVDRDLTILEHSRQAPAQLKPSESEDTQTHHEHQQNLSEQRQLFEG